jgi:predicted TPR repeat methyltransferase
LEDWNGCAAAALRPGGALIFTVEEGIDVGTDVARTSSGRYVPTVEYVDRVVTAANFRSEIGRAFLRFEHGPPVAGLVVRATHADDPAAVARWGIVDHDE